MNRFLHIIVNQQSKNSMNHLKTLLIELPKYTKHYKIYQTEDVDQLDRLILLLKDTIKPNDLLVIVGGDGSLNQSVSLLEKYDVDNAIGYIPSGSGNDFARTNDIPFNVKDSIAHLFNVQKAQDLTIIQAVEGDRDIYAVNSMGIGIDGLVNQVIFEQKKNKGAGILTYLSSLVSEFRQQDKFAVTLKVDEGVFTFEKVQLALIVNNAYFGGGLEIMPSADGADDTLEVLIGENINFGDLMNIIARILSNKSHLKHPKLHTFKTKHVALFTEAEQYAQKDGEVFQQEGFAYVASPKKRAFWI